MIIFYDKGFSKMILEQLINEVKFMAIDILF